jgi:hypothetical protein
VNLQIVVENMFILRKLVPGGGGWGRNVGGMRIQSIGEFDEDFWEGQDKILFN